MTQKRSIVLMPLGGPFRIVGVLPPVLYNIAYSRTLAAFGGVGIAKFTLTGALPLGIAWVDNGDSTCTFSGKSAEVGGDFPITVSAIDTARNPATASYTLKVMRFPMPKLIVAEAANGGKVLCPEGKPNTQLRTE